MRFLCDEMLGRFARYLRAAGYDTLLAAGGLPDRAWLQRARHDDRHFLTCDRAILEHKAAVGTAFVLARADLAFAASAVTAAFDVDWLHAPFTRCLVDNEVLIGVTAQEHTHVPDDVAVRESRQCPGCGRIYWAGSHYRRMRQRLVAWAAGDFGIDRGGSRPPAAHSL